MNDSGHMSALESVEGLIITTATLMICDAAGRLSAVSAASTDAVCVRAGADQKHFAEVFGRDSSITRWITEHMGEARKREDYIAQASVENGSSLLTLKLETLKCGGELYGFALHLLPKAAGSDNLTLNEGDAVVTRQQWHDIKNHLGGLKLYATFLKRKLPAGDDQQTVEKMLKGVDVLIDLLARFRRTGERPR